MNRALGAKGVFSWSSLPRIHATLPDTFPRHDTILSSNLPGTLRLPLSSRNINDAAQSVILLCLLPFLNISSFAYLYTALPLHIVDQGWPLWHLSILMSVCFVPRLVLSAIAVRVGEWLAVCTTCIGAALSILIVVAPNNLTAVYAGVFGTCLAVMAPTYRSLVYKRFGSDGDWQQQRALRWFTLFDTIGYSCGPFVGGSLYDIGGFQACGIFQTVAQFACTLLPLALPDVQRSFRGCCTWRHLQPVATTTALESAAVPSTTASVTAVPAVPIPASPTPAATAPLSSATALAPAIALLFAAFTNICVYGVEWALYALYFRSVYSWSGAATGAAQMAGDLLGGITLALSTLGCVSRAASRWQQVIPACLHAWFRPPLNVALLLGCHGALLALLAQPQFAVACTGQGTRSAAASRIERLDGPHISPPASDYYS